MQTGPTGNKRINGKLVTVDREKHRKYSREQQRKRRLDPEYRKRINKNASISKSKLYHYYKNLILDIFNRKCVKCGFNDIRALQIDHINNDGYTERKKYSGATSYRFLKKVYKSLIEGSKRYQILCANCNQIKKFGYRSSLKSRITNRESNPLS